MGMAMSLLSSLKAGERLVGTFIKTPHHVVIEALGRSGLDFFILDAEHSAFGVAEIDRCILAARAVRKPVLVRLADQRAADILRVLDMGADGFLVLHVTTADQARAIVGKARYGEGGRGYAATNRAGDYGMRTMAEHLAASSDIVIIPQVEDPLAIRNIESIAAVEGISALFVGPADLAVAYGVNDPASPRVTEALDQVVAVAGNTGLPVASFVPTMPQARTLFARGLQVVAVASEHKPIQDFFAPAAVATAKST